MTDTPLISLRSASFGYADRAVVEGVTLTQGRGEVIALLGPNGSGKSTLVKGLLGLSDHLGGEVALFGTPLARFRDKPRIGYVPQRHSLSSSVRATVREVVEVGRLPLRPFWRPSGSEDARAVDEALDAVGLRDREREDVATLSGGQQRRVLIARALAAGPDLLVMDEPTAGVDAANQAVLAEVLSVLAARGTSMLIVTHEPGGTARRRDPDRLHGRRARRLRRGADGVGQRPPRPRGRRRAPPRVPHRRRPPTGARRHRHRPPSHARGAPMSDLLSLDFMRQALVAAVLVGLAAPLVGAFLVQRRMSLIGDGIGHVALAGVAIGILTGSMPVFTALVAAVAAAVGVEAHPGRGSYER